jgi:carbamoyltransferase
MKIGFCGTMSVGKTTLVNALKDLPEFKDYVSRTERSKYLMEMGIPLNTDSTLKGQLVFAAERASELMQEKIITDRTVVDVMSLSKKNSVKSILQNSFQKKINAKIVYVPHHISHIASSYFLSGFNDAIGLTVDGSGDFSTSESFLLEGNLVKTIDKTIYPHSLGIFYQTFTQFLGFKNYGDEYKVMGLSSYGTPKYKNRLKKIINYDENGNFKLNLNYFNHHKSSLNFIFDDGKPIFSNFFNINFLDLFGSERSLDEKIEIYHKDLAASVQNIFEEIIILKLKNLKKKK